MSKNNNFKNLNDFINYCLNELLLLTNEKIFLVGGLIRERMLGNDSYDYDFIVNENALEIAEKLAKRTRGAFVLLDPDRFIGRVVWNTERNGYELNFDIAKAIGSIENDLKYRDITINSIAIEVNNENCRKLSDNSLEFTEKNITDFTNGFRDLKNGVVRTYQKNNLIDDPLRMLRIFRFAARFNFKIENETLKYINELSGLITNPAKERVLKELLDIFHSNDSSKFLKKMFEVNIFSYLFPEYGNIDFRGAINEIEKYEKLVNQDSERCNYKNEIKSYLSVELIYNHNKYSLLKLVILFSYFKKTDDTPTKFIKSIEKLLKEYTFSSIEQQFILKNINHYFEYSEIEKLELNRTNLYKLFKYRGNEVIGTLLLNYLKIDESYINKLVEIFKYYIEDKVLSVQPVLINGQDLIKELNLKPGKVIGEILASVQQAQAELRINTKEQALLFAKNMIL